MLIQLIQYCILNLLPKGHVVGKFAMLHPYRKRIASEKCCFDSSKPKSLIGSAVSQFDTLFLGLHPVIFWIFLIDYFLTGLTWRGIDLAFFMTCLVILIWFLSTVYCLIWFLIRGVSWAVSFFELLLFTSACL